MKKVLLSLTSLLFIFNISFVNAEEIEVLNNEDNESTEVLESNDNEVIENNENEVTDVKTYVALVDGVNYETLDEAINAAKDNDTIKLLSNATTSGIYLSKNLIIDGGNNTITFNDKGINLTGKTLTIKNATVNMIGIIGTPNGANWATIVASPNAKLILDNTTMTLDQNGISNSNAHAIYFCGNNKLELNNSKLEIKNYKQDALEWDGGDGGYNILLTNSTYNSINNRSGFTGTFYAVIDNSKVNVINSAGNGSNGTYYTIKNNSEVTFEKNGSWGISAWRIDISTNSKLYANNNGYSGIWTRVLNVDASSSLTANNNGTKAPASTNNAGILFFGNKEIASTIEKGANVEIKNNAGSGIYVSNTYGNLTINAGNITNNGTGKVNKNNTGALLGGGIYNKGTVVIGEDVNIYNNHAKEAADDIYNMNGANIEFLGTKNDWVLDDCNDKIDNWYDDSNENRWNAHGKTENEIHVEEINKDSYKSNKELTIKAAHNLYGKVTARYVDKDGNEIAKSIITNGKYRSEYKTEEKEIQYYELIDVEGLEEGTYGLNDITVTYIYEYVGGTGGDDPDFPRTGIESNNIVEIIAMVSLVALGTTIVLKKKLI